MLLGSPEVGEGLCDKVPQALVFTKQHILCSGCRADGKPKNCYLAFTDTKSAKPSYSNCFFWWWCCFFGLSCDSCQRIGKELIEMMLNWSVSCFSSGESPMF